MPMGNRMGPNGMGPGTGRGAGFCNGFNMPGTFNRGGRGRGFAAGNMGGGFQSGRHAGYGYIGRYQAISEDQQNEMLREEAEFLEKRLNFIKEQLERNVKNAD